LKCLARPNQANRKSRYKKQLSNFCDVMEQEA
jgi:hypothetical protein